MSIDARKVQVLQVAAFLIKNHNYKLVRVKHNDDELWLGNPSNRDYPIIRVTSNNTDSLFFDKNRILKLSAVVCELLRVKAKPLSIHITDEIDVDPEEDMYVSVLTQNSVYGEHIINSFPLIVSSLYPFENPETEYHTILKDLDEHQKGKKAQKKRVKQSTRKYLNATNVIIAICILVFLFIRYLNTQFDSEVVNSIVAGAYYKALVVANHEYFRFFTSGFVHVSAIHLLMNMYSFNYVSKFVERQFGTVKMLAILFISIIMGSVATFILDDNVVAYGLSGGVYGLLGAYFVIAYTMGAFRNQQFMRQLSTLIMVNLMINFMPGIGVYAHLGGLVAGAVLGFIFVKFKRWKEHQFHMKIAAGLMSLFIIYQVVIIDSYTPQYQGTDSAYVSQMYEMGLDSYATKTLKGFEAYYRTHK